MQQEQQKRASDSPTSSPKRWKAEAVRDVTKNVLDLTVIRGFVDRHSLASFASTHKEERDAWPALGAVFQALTCPYTITKDQFRMRATFAYIRRVGRGNRDVADRIYEYNMRSAEERDREWEEWMQSFEQVALPALDRFPVEVVRERLVRLALTLVISNQHRLVDHRERLMGFVFPRVIADTEACHLFWEMLWKQMNADCVQFHDVPSNHVRDTAFLGESDPALLSCDSMAEQMDCGDFDILEEYWVHAIMRVPSALVAVDPSAAGKALARVWTPVATFAIPSLMRECLLLITMGLAADRGLDRSAFFEGVLTSFGYSPHSCWCLAKRCPEHMDLVAGYDAGIHSNEATWFEDRMMTRAETEEYIQGLRDRADEFVDLDAQFDPNYESDEEDSSEEERRINDMVSQTAEAMQAMRELMVAALQGDDHVFNQLLARHTGQARQAQEEDDLANALSEFL